MARIIIVHRWSGGPGDDWRPWLRKELEQLGHEVLMPAMPNTDTPIIRNWVDHLAKIVGTSDKKTFFIGHSIGNQAILRYLEMISTSSPQTTVGGAVFVVGWFNLKNLEDIKTEKIANPWLEIPIHAEKIKKVLSRPPTSKSTLIISDNDPFDCFEENKQKFAELGSDIVVVPHAGHFTSDDGFETFPQLLEIIKKIIT